MFHEKFFPCPSLAESAEIERLQGNIGLHDVGRQIAPNPAEQAIPIAADSKGLGNRLTTQVCMVVPERPQEPERGSGVTSLGQIKRPKQKGLFEQAVRWMQETEDANKRRSRGIALLRDKLGGLSQPKQRDNQEDNPGTPADESRGLRLPKPGRSGYEEHREGRNSPTAIQAAATPGLGQQHERRDAGEEEQDVVEIEHVVLMRR